jgi:hypothetical protein
MMNVDNAGIDHKLSTMRLHDTISCGDIEILKVHEGWLYTIFKRVHCEGVGNQIVMTTTFVPYK